MLMDGVSLSEDLLGRIHHGDCIAGMNALPAGSIDLVFADPPFNIGYDYDVYHDAKEYDQYLAWSRDWIGAVHRVNIGLVMGAGGQRRFTGHG